MIIEKDAVFQRLVQEGFPAATNSILVTGKGMPDHATRCFVSTLLSQDPQLLVCGGMLAYCLTAPCSPENLTISDLDEFMNQRVQGCPDSKPRHTPVMAQIGLD